MKRTARADQRLPRAEVKRQQLPPRQAAADRRERVPLGVARQKLQVPSRPGYNRRWVNDDDKGRLQNALEGGYSHVTDPKLKVGQDGGGDRTDSRVSRIVGKGRNGQPIRAYLMEIPRELFQQDQKSKQGNLDEVDRAIKKGRLVADGQDSRYVPDQGRGIKIDHEKITVGAREEDPNAE